MFAIGQPLTKVAQISRDPAEFPPQRLFPFELPRLSLLVGPPAQSSLICITFTELTSHLRCTAERLARPLAQ